MKYKAGKIHQIPLWEDNYIYILQEGEKAVAIDPGDFETVQYFLSQKKLKLKLILNTHHHFDHVGGNKKLKEYWSCPIYAHQKDAHRIPGLDFLTIQDQLTKENKLSRQNQFFIKDKSSREEKTCNFKKSDALNEYTIQAESSMKADFLNKGLFFDKGRLSDNSKDLKKEYTIQAESSMKADFLNKDLFFDEGRLSDNSKDLKKDQLLEEGDEFSAGSFHFKVLFTPGHTLGHIIFWDQKNKLLFCGDTLFAMGCGRLFEGNPEQMFQSLGQIKKLPLDTLIYSAHEYTLKNAEFALSIEPANKELKKRYEKVKKIRENQQATIPFLLKEELLTNPFLRAKSVSEFAKIRKLRDRF